MGWRQHRTASGDRLGAGAALSFALSLTCEQTGHGDFPSSGTEAGGTGPGAGLALLWELAHGYRHCSVVMHIQTEYGVVARPPLEMSVCHRNRLWYGRQRPKTWPRNDRAGWEFFIDIIKQCPFYRDDVVRWLERVCQ